MFEPWKTVRLVSVPEMYGTVTPKIPDGFRAIAFRPVRKGERFLSACSGEVVRASADYAEGNPVIILAPALTEIEVIPIGEINHAYERMEKADVKYRFVIDMSTL